MTGQVMEMQGPPGADQGARSGTAVATVTPGNGAVAITPPADSLTQALDMLIRAATDPAVDVAKMERLMAMHERLTTQRAKLAFDDAMALAQAEMRPVVADADNTQTKSKYASYVALDRVLRPIYVRHGFSLSFDTGEGAPGNRVPENHVRVICYVAHRGGFSRPYHADMPADGKGAKGGDVMTKTHATGSAYTYGQRYLLKLIFNVAVGEDDDDGNAAGKANITAAQKQELIEKQKAVGANTAAFLKYLGVATLDYLAADKFDAAMAALEKKARTMKGVA